MKITEDQVLEKKLVGKTKNGEPVLYVVSHGGLFMFFTKKKDGEVVSLSAAPHRAIAKWMAEKKEDITWNKDFIEKKENFIDELQKHEKNSFKNFRDVLFSENQERLDKYEGYYAVYHQADKQIEVLGKKEVFERIKEKEIVKNDIIRELTLDKAPCVVGKHKVFGDFFDG